MSFTGGTQSTSVYVALTITVSDPLDGSTYPLGCVGVANVQGLPLGTKLVVNGVTQRLVPGPRGEPCAWWLPNTHTSTPFTIQIFNDVNGSPSIAAGATFAIGEIFVGRVMSLPSLTGSSPPIPDLFDPTAHQSSSGGQDWPLMRKPRRITSAHLGYFNRADAKGGSTSSLVSGAYPAGVIDIQTLREILSTTNICAVCDTPCDYMGGTVTGGIRYDQNFMQGNWMVAKVRSLGQIPNDQPPLWSWPVSLMEAT